MEPNILFTEAGKLGFVVLLLLAAVYGLVKWVQGLESARNKRDSEEKVLSLAREAEARKDCIERERSLADRLRLVEDRQHGEATILLTSAVKALESNAYALKRLTDEDSGLRLALIDTRKP